MGSHVPPGDDSNNLFQTQDFEVLCHLGGLKISLSTFTKEKINFMVFSPPHPQIPFLELKP